MRDGAVRGRLGAHGRATSTGHVPEHAKAAMEKKKAAWYCPIYIYIYVYMFIYIW
jgi:hypothetical protein